MSANDQAIKLLEQSKSITVDPLLLYELEQLYKTGIAMGKPLEEICVEWLNHVCKFLNQ
jgi:hypothetical protein